jgi:hypothetical protein
MRLKDGIDMNTYEYAAMRRNAVTYAQLARLNRAEAAKLEREQPLMWESRARRAEGIAIAFRLAAQWMREDMRWAKVEEHA